MGATLKDLITVVRASKNLSSSNVIKTRKLGRTAKRAIGVSLFMVLLTPLATAQNNGSNVREFSCSETPRTFTLCKDGNDCRTVRPGESPQDIVTITGVTANDTITFDVEHAGTVTPPSVNVSPIQVDISGQMGTGDPSPNPISVTNGGPVVSPEYTVTVGDAADNQSRFQIQIETNPQPQPPAVAVVNYTVQCTPVDPPPMNQGRIIIQKTAINGDGTTQFNFTGGLPAFSLTPPANGTVSTFPPNFDNLDPGTYVVSETPVADWTTSVTCSDPDGETITSNGTATIDLDEGETIVCEFTNEFNGEPNPSLDLDKEALKDTFSAPGQTIDYKYTVTNTGNVPIEVTSLTDDKVNNISCTLLLPTILQPANSIMCTGSYVVKTEDLTACKIENTAEVTGTPQTSGSDPITVEDSEEITCTGDRTEELIRDFIHRRVDLLASNEPDRARMMRRFNRRPPPIGSVKDGPMKLMGKSDANGTKVSFATSLSQIARANVAAAQKKVESVTPMGLGATTAPSYYPQVPGVDVWVEGHFQRFDDKLGGNDQDGDFGILWVGADYLVSPSFLIGALVQFDWMDQQTPSLSNADVRGRGWMAGPYATVKFSDHLFFDTRAAWGQSDNDITPFGTYTDSFDTERWLAKANLTGNWNFGHLYVTPSVGVIYVEEDAETYVDFVGNTILGQTVRLGRLTFGPEFRYKSYGTDGSILEPHISFTGMWDFDEDDDADIANVGGLLVSDDDFRVKIEAGLLAHNPNFSAASFRATVSYDGLGDDDFSALGGQLWVNWPLN